MSKVKLPAFLYNLLHTWWLNCKSIFATFKIKSPSEKYNHLVASLPSDVTHKLLHVMTYLVVEGYDINLRLDLLKSALMQRYSPTDFESYCNFSTQQSLQPGQKPSTLCDFCPATLMLTDMSFSSSTPSCCCCPHRPGHSAWPASWWTLRSWQLLRKRFTVQQSYGQFLLSTMNPTSTWPVQSPSKRHPLCPCLHLHATVWSQSGTLSQDWMP